jgi:hypothetical protein
MAPFGVTVGKDVTEAPDAVEEGDDDEVVVVGGTTVFNLHAVPGQ